MEHLLERPQDTCRPQVPRIKTRSMHGGKDRAIGVPQAGDGDKGIFREELTSFLTRSHAGLPLVFGGLTTCWCRGPWYLGPLVWLEQ